MTEQTQHPDLLDPGGGPHRRLPLYEFRRIRCPFCRSARLAMNRTINQGDGSQLRYYRCASCDEPFKAIVE